MMLLSFFSSQGVYGMLKHVLESYGGGEVHGDKDGASMAKTKTKS